MKSTVKPAALAAPVKNVSEVVTRHVCDSEFLEAHAPLIQKGFVSMYLDSAMFVKHD